MCILCVIQKWSRRVATMLPWLVIPLIGLWALSQLLPPAFRFEITSPRLACVFVLLVTLFWYEILMPQLSAWRVRRNARLREKKRFEAIELQKLRKTATRRCRNCLTPYRDQNPGGGRFMCSYCGHISKRPVLDLPVPSGMGISNSGIVKDLVGKGGKILNGKLWSDNGWMCNGQDWLENGNWGGGSFGGKSAYWRQSAGGGGGYFGGDDDCMTENSYWGVVSFVCKLLMSFFVGINWLWRKVFRLSSSGEDILSDEEQSGVLAKSGENGANPHESRSDKARRKAEEKRQARLEKELLEEEERKQREEVARLVEECRRLRDVKVETEKDRGKGASLIKEKDSKREAEKKRQERKKDKDKGSSKSNSDVEELEKRVGKENDRKRESEKKSDIDRREHQKSGAENVKAHDRMKGVSSNYSRGNTGTRYLDRMKGSFFSSSKALSDGSFFGRGAGNSVTATRENKFTGSVDPTYTSVNRRESYQPDRVAGRVNINGDDKHIHRPVPPEPQLTSAPKKSWHQLFTRSSPAPTPSNSNVIGRPSIKSEAEAKNNLSTSQALSAQTFDNPLNFGLPSLFTPSSFPTGPTNRSTGFSSATESMFPRVGDAPNKLLHEEPELFEDPCYTPDPVSLLGPVSESLDNFQLDLGTSFGTDIGLEKPWGLKNVSAPCEVSKPSPIESPLSRLRVADDRHNCSNWLPSTPKFQNVKPVPNDDPFNVNETGTWQMWNSSPLGQDGLGLIGAGANWFSPTEQNRSSREETLHSSGHKSMASMFTNDDQVLSGANSPGQVYTGNSQKGGTFSSPVHGSRDHDPWLEKAFFPPLSASDGHFALNPQEDTGRNEMIYGSPRRSARNHLFEQSPSGWPKKEWSIHGPVEGIANPSVVKPHVGGLYSTPDVQSLWSYD